MEIEKQMDKLYHKLCKLAAQGRFVLFSKVIAGFQRLEAIKTFIVLLFLAQKGDISLWQNEEQTEIYIVLKGAGSAEEKPPVGVV